METRMEQFYSLSAKTLSGEEKSMEQFRGKVVIVVNTASKCGFTPQYDGLQKLYETYKERGLVILGFPCNQFANQEPGAATDIAEGCRINYGVSFPLFDKIDVNGKDAHPLFVFLKKECSGLLGSRIKWNFTKFLLNKEGKPVKRFSPRTEPEDMAKYIEELL